MYEEWLDLIELFWEDKEIEQPVQIPLRIERLPERAPCVEDETEQRVIIIEM